MQTVTNTEVKAAFGILQAVAEAIREPGEVPSGHLYANLMSKLSLAQFEQVLGVLEGSRGWSGSRTPTCSPGSDPPSRKARATFVPLIAEDAAGHSGMKMDSAITIAPT